MSGEARRVKNKAETTRNLFPQRGFATRSFAPQPFSLSLTNRQRRRLKPKKLVIKNFDIYFPVM